MNPLPKLIEVRADTGKLLFRASADGRVVEVVERRRRYVVELGILRADPVIVVCAVIEEDEEKHNETLNL